MNMVFPVLSLITELIRQLALKKPVGHTTLGKAEGMFEGRIGLLNRHDQLGKQPGKIEVKFSGTS